MKAKAAYDSWLLSLYVLSGIEQGVIPHSLFNEQLIIKTNGKIVATIKSPENQEVDIDVIADNLKNITLGNCFLAFDEALDQAFGAKPKQYSDSDTDSLRAIIYMMRCAFAHTPSLPKWCIKPKYRKILSLEKIHFLIDFSQLNGKELISEHHGGMFSLLQLMDYCMDEIKKRSSLKNSEPPITIE